VTGGRSEGNPVPWYAAKPWIGMSLGAWASFLRRNQFRISVRRLPDACCITFGSMLHSLARAYQRRRHGRRIAAVQPSPPIFVVGHWRSGTTLLHELLTQDPRSGFADTFECFCPSEAISTRWFLPRLRFLLPERRPMDDMPVSWNAPQEDEWALANLGLPSPYASLAFPNQGLDRRDGLDVRALSPARRRQWAEGLRWFVQMVSVRVGGRIVLKSPTHTARLEAILEVFPEARFVHIVRDPRAVYRSTLRLWRTLGSHVALQEPTFDGLEESVLATYEAMFQAYERDRPRVPAGRLVELRYEDLVADPIGQVRGIYDALGLDGFDELAPRIAEYFADRRAYQVHQYPRDVDVDEIVDRRWLPFVRRFGYRTAGEAGPSSPRAASVASISSAL